MTLDERSFRKRAAHAAERAADTWAGDDVDRYLRIADVVIAEFAKPTAAMIDAAFEAVRFDEGWAVNSRRDFLKAVTAMVRAAR